MQHILPSAYSLMYFHLFFYLIVIGSEQLGVCVVLLFQKKKIAPPLLLMRGEGDFGKAAANLNFIL